MSAPSIASEPAVGVSSPAIRRSSVVLPQPEGPRSAKNSPAPISRLTLLTAAIPPNDRVMPSMRISVPPPVPGGTIAESPLVVGAHHVLVEVDDRAGHHLRGVGQQIDRGGGHVVRLDQPAEGLL